MNSTTILVVHSERTVAEMLGGLIDGPSRKILVTTDLANATHLLALGQPQLVLLDDDLPGLDSADFVKQNQPPSEKNPLIILTGSASVARAVELMRKGAFSYLTIPFDQRQLADVVDEALAHRLTIVSAETTSAQPPRAAGGLRVTMGSSSCIQRLESDVRRVAASEFTVLIRGETGSGKELVARRIHDLSPRAKGPFIPVDCGAIAESLLESELFGHEKGAFTGASRRKAGKFEAAKGGTLVLDEIGNMSLGAQAKLLRVLQEKQLYRVGGNATVDVDVRVIASTNENLELAMEESSFRRDLFFRLNEFSIQIPPLRRRREDIPYLAKRFLDKTNQELNKAVRGFTESAIESLLGYDWPGNVRQFRATIRRAVLLADDVVTDQQLDLKRASVPGLAFTPKVQGLPWQGMSLKEIVRRSTVAVEREVLKAVLRITGGNKAKAARMLSIDYKTIHTKVKKYNIDLERPHSGAKPATVDLASFSSKSWSN